MYLQPSLGLGTCSPHCRSEQGGFAPLLRDVQERYSPVFLVTSAVTGLQKSQMGIFLGPVPEANAGSLGGRKLEAGQGVGSPGLSNPPTPQPPDCLASGPEPSGGSRGGWIGGGGCGWREGLEGWAALPAVTSYGAEGRQAAGSKPSPPPAGACSVGLRRCCCSCCSPGGHARRSRFPSPSRLQRPPEPGHATGSGPASLAAGDAPGRVPGRDRPPAER